MEPLPVLLSIPHGGTQVPEELQDRVDLRPVDVWNDIDAYSTQVYDLGEEAAVVMTTPYARTFVDLNRSSDDRPPQNIDGVVKSHTCYKRVVYAEGQEPDEALTEVLLDRYYWPYHRQIQASVTGQSSAALQLGLDCHTMSDLGPDVAPDPHGKRPLICLGNAHGRACPAEMLRRMAACFVAAFECRSSDVTENVPFAGGYITQAYGHNPIPWIQIEMNQALYLEPRRSMDELPVVDAERLNAVRQRFGQALKLFFSGSP